MYKTPIIVLDEKIIGYNPGILADNVQNVTALSGSSTRNCVESGYHSDACNITMNFAPFV
jgi:hypothetical protein